MKAFEVNMHIFIEKKIKFSVEFQHVHHFTFRFGVIRVSYCKIRAASMKPSKGVRTKMWTSSEEQDLQIKHAFHQLYFWPAVTLMIECH